VTVALAVYDFCVRERADAMLLALIDRIARACLKRADAGTRDLVHLVLADVPYGFTHLEAGHTPPPCRRAALGPALRAVLSSTAPPRD